MRKSPVLPDALRAPITDIASAKAWVRALVAADLAFHFEDDPGEIIYTGSGKNIFAKKDVRLIRERVASLYALTWGPDGQYYCPIGFMMTCEPFNEHNQAKGFEVGAELEYEAEDGIVIDRAHCASYDYGAPGRYHLFKGGKLIGAYDTPAQWESAIKALAA